MDPTECLRRMLRAIKDGDRDEAGKAGEDLVDWLARAEGFLPSPEDLATVCTEFALADVEVNSRAVLKALRGTPPAFASDATKVTPKNEKPSGWPYKPVEKPPGTIPHR